MASLSSFSSYSSSSTLYKTNSPTTPRLFPPTFGFYKTRNSDLHIALSSKDPNPLYYACTYNGFRSRPDITLHPGHNKAYSQVASAQFQGCSGTPHITLGSTRYGAAPTAKLTQEAFFHTVHHFSLYLPELRRRERFEWKNSCGSEVRMLGHSTGMKLVRTRTGEVVAAYANVTAALTKKGKMGFLLSEKSIRVLGNEFQLMAVMSLLCILEGERRRKEMTTYRAGTMKTYGAGARASC